MFSTGEKNDWTEVVPMGPIHNKTTSFQVMVWGVLTWTSSSNKSRAENDFYTISLLWIKISASIKRLKSIYTGASEPFRRLKPGATRATDCSFNSLFMLTKVKYQISNGPVWAECTSHQCLFLTKGPWCRKRFNIMTLLWDGEIKYGITGYVPL